MKRSCLKTVLAAVCLFSVTVVSLSADESFGFDSPDVAGTGGTETKPVTVGGEVSAGTSAYMEALADFSKVADIRAGNLFSGRLDFSATGSNADAVINLKLKPSDAGASPLAIDEAYLRAYFGKLDIEAGLRKLTWGKADSAGPLDVTNPLDLTDLTVTDSLERKIARPMVHGTLSLGPFTRLEALVIPSFEGHRFTTQGRWAPSQVTELPFDMTDSFPDTTALENTQTGIRLTTTFGSSDIGIQYFYGNLSRPAISVTGFEGMPPDIQIHISYNRYHQIGADYASVLGGLNVRLEAAANITEDLSGDDGSVYNPAILWSAGFDRDVIAGINVNLQGSGSVRLMDGRVGDSIADTEAGTDMVRTKITAQLSKKLFRDALELKAAGVYDIGYADWLVMPALVWTKGDIEAEVAAGFFGGDADGELGQYDANDYLKLMVTYRF